MHHCSSSVLWVSKSSSKSASQPVSHQCYAMQHAAFRHNMKWPYNLWLPLMQKELQVVLYMYVCSLSGGVRGTRSSCNSTDPSFFSVHDWEFCFWLFDFLSKVIRCRMTALNCCMPKRFNGVLKYKNHMYENLCPLEYHQNVFHNSS